MAKFKEINLTNELSEINKLFSLTEELNQQFHLDPSVAFNINLAMEEALTNVILYAYPNNHGKITLLVDYEDGYLSFTIKDEGVAFNPLTDAAEADITSPAESREIGGLGVFLFRTLMDKVTYKRTDSNNILTLKKKII